MIERVKLRPPTVPAYSCLAAFSIAIAASSRARAMPVRVYGKFNVAVLARAHGERKQVGYALA
jgi:hypothetical protein